MAEVWADADVRSESGAAIGASLANLLPAGSVGVAGLKLPVKIGAGEWIRILAPDVGNATLAAKISLLQDTIENETRHPRTRQPLKRQTLNLIDKTRDDYGTPESEPRHPDLASGKAWPITTLDPEGCC